ncbi:hypothetical protein ACQPW1_42455 [Nocardia sp. CA-128927]|uniref:hypothetical protein n=1 Tax=Nocardia sp. CA-128927 TaxID=3239975 RepID=UPI003D957D65
MSSPIRDFGETAKSLAHNPLGIIALFIVLVYGLAALVTAFSGSFTTAERTPLIYFLIGFPILVLGVFTWLVIRHSGKLFSPRDFKNEENYITALTATASLAVATSTHNPELASINIDQLVAAVRAATDTPGETAAGAFWHRHVLWVDDRPENNVYERNAFEALGLSFTLALSTDVALRELEQQRFAAIISDMGRREGPREGYVLLDRIRGAGDKTPFFIYSSSNALERRNETLEHDGQGTTNMAGELFEMVMSAVVKR